MTSDGPEGGHAAGGKMRFISGASIPRFPKFATTRSCRGVAPSPSSPRSRSDGGYLTLRCVNVVAASDVQVPGARKSGEPLERWTRLGGLFDLAEVTIAGRRQIHPMDQRTRRRAASDRARSTVFARTNTKSSAANRESILRRPGPHHQRSRPLTSLGHAMRRRPSCRAEGWTAKA